MFRTSYRDFESKEAKKPDLGSNGHIIFEAEKLDCLTDLKAHLNAVVSVIGIRIRAAGDTVVTIAKRRYLKWGRNK